MGCVIGIDIGTSNIKAGAYDMDGQRIAFASRRMITYHPGRDMSEFDPEEIWKSVCSCLHEVIGTAGANQVEAIGVSSMAEAGVPIDIHGNPLYPIIAWFDPRTIPQAEWWAQEFGPKKIFSITGHHLAEKYGINKLMWIRDNVPQVFKLMTKWLSMEDYIIFRLSGEYATDYSIAARTMAFDVNKCKWSDEIMEKASILKELMPQAYPGGTVVGKIRASVSLETGLKPGIPVVTGGHDHACAAVAVNIFEPGVILDSMGTAESTMIAVENIRPTAEAFDNVLSMYPHCGEPSGRVATSIMACGASIEWLLARFGRELHEKSSNGQKNLYDLLMQEAEKSLPGSYGLHFIPHIRGVVGAPYSKGAIIGIKDSHNFGDFARAIIEGLSYELRSRLESCEKVFHGSYTKLRVVGGATKSYFWMQTKANILSREVEVPNNDEAASFGAALLAAVGAGIFKSEKEAAERFYMVKNSYKPEDNQEIFDVGYKFQIKAINALNSIYKEFYK